MVKIQSIDGCELMKEFDDIQYYYIKNVVTMLSGILFILGKVGVDVEIIQEMGVDDRGIDYQVKIVCNLQKDTSSLVNLPAVPGWMFIVQIPNPRSSNDDLNSIWDWVYII